MRINEGNPISLSEILNQKDKRVNLIDELIKQYPNYSVLSFKLNIPGPIKNNSLIQMIYDEGILVLQNFRIIDYLSFRDLDTGPEALIIINELPQSLKKRMIAIEENHPLGRIFDLDVISQNRDMLGFKRRQCLICHKPAIECSRSQAHPLEDLLKKIESITYDFLKRKEKENE